MVVDWFDAWQSSRWLSGECRKPGASACMCNAMHARERCCLHMLACGLPMGSELLYVLLHRCTAPTGLNTTLAGHPLVDLRGCLSGHDTKGDTHTFRQVAMKGMRKMFAGSFLHNVIQVQRRFPRVDKPAEARKPPFLY